MPSCHSSSDSTVKNSTFTVALAGNPNSGKTTIFNALTGLRQKVANYPGVTVEKKTGKCKLPDGRTVSVIDLPGTYSLISRSPDEHVAMEVLRGLRADTPAPDVVVVVVDASNLQRNLYLVSQLIEVGRPLVVALNMMDVAERRGINVSPAKLAGKLGVPVIPVVGHRGIGIPNLKLAIAEARVAPLPDWPLPAAMKEEVSVVGGGLAILDDVSPAKNSPAHGPGFIELSQRRLDRYHAIAERLLIGDRADDVADFARREPVSKLLAAAIFRLDALGIDPMQADVEAHYRWIEDVAHTASGTDFQPVLEVPEHGLKTRATVELNYAAEKNLTERVDSILIHQVWGLLIFAGIMAVLFVSIFWLAAPMMDALQGAVTWLGKVASARLSDGPVKDLLTDGIFAGVGSVIVFVPQIALLFMFLAILEDSGYLARAAFLMDRLLSKVGLHGKSFIPLLSSFACAIPGIMATRTIENRKDRLATIFVAPFMSCSARLPVYTLLIGTFFATYGAITQAGIMLSLYALGIIAAAATAWCFKRSLLKGPKQAFILEMPTYKVPQASQVARQVWGNTKAFVTKAGTIIFCLSVILWALMYYPRMSEQQRLAVTQSTLESEHSRIGSKGLAPNYQSKLDDAKDSIDAEGVRTFERRAAAYLTIREEQVEEAVEKAVASEQLRYSLAGRFGHAIEPAIKPLGYDWKMGVGLVGAFAAREVFVSTMGIVYSVGDPGDDTADLKTQMQNDQVNGKPVWSKAVAASLLVWFVLAMQCMSTLAIVKRETGGWKWPVFMLVYMNALAYVVSLIVYQVGVRLVG